MTYLKEIHIEICNELSRTRTKMASSQMRGFVWRSAWFCMEICVVLYGNLRGAHQKDRYTARRSQNGGGSCVDLINCWGH